jgi:hypothetical protein
MAPRQSPSERLLPIVEAFVDDLERRRRERLRRVHGQGKAFEEALARTDSWDDAERLPATGDAKVNVQALVDRLGLKESDRQWFYKSDELAGPVNALAAAQGLKPVRSRVQQQSDDDAAVTAIVRARSESKKLAESLVEVTRERDRLRAQLRLLREGGWTIRTGPIKGGP